MIAQIIKRDGRRVPFDEAKIVQAIFKAFQGSGSAKGRDTARELSEQVLEQLNRNEAIDAPTVEEVQDVVERVLIENGFVRTAKAYILYRAERSRAREM
ncbi:MAG: ATP cone domain-containing protein, partial [Clostridia bacterium]